MQLPRRELTPEEKKAILDSVAKRNTPVRILPTPLEALPPGYREQQLAEVYDPQETAVDDYTGEVVAEPTPPPPPRIGREQGENLLAGIRGAVPEALAEIDPNAPRGVSVAMGEPEILSRTPQPGGSGAGVQGMVSRAANMAGDTAKGAGAPGRRPLDVSASAPPAFAEMTPEQQQAILDAAKQRAQKAGMFSGMGEVLGSSADLITGRRAPHVNTSGLAANAQAELDEGQKRVQMAKDYVASQRKNAAAEALAQRQASQDELNRRNVESQIAAREQPKEADPLLEERRALLQAQTAAAQRRGQPRAAGAGGEKPVSEKERLQIQKLRQEVEGVDPRKVRAAEASREKMRGMISELRELHRVNGPTMTGEVGTRMGQLMQMIAVEAKNIAELGALSGPDLGMVQKIQGTDPTSLWVNTFGTDNTQNSLTELESWVDRAAEAARKVHGGGGAAPAAPAVGAQASPGPQAQSGGLVTVIRKRDGKSKQVTREQAARFASDPNYEVR